ncbi:MAG TPA: PIN domain-containing protein [Thermoleophilaceae bacterium]|nr:PIN domain-containing protein [Thermoleophilaceae bacterium]
MLFVDASFWIALRFPRDDWHDSASRLFRQYADKPLLTTNLVRSETWTFLRGRVGHRSAVHAFESMSRSPRVEVAQVTAGLEEEAFEWLRRHDERSYSFVDATSFALMRKKKITSVLAFDADFSAAGFLELRS